MNISDSAFSPHINHQTQKMRNRIRQKLKRKRSETQACRQILEKRWTPTPKTKHLNDEKHENNTKIPIPCATACSRLQHASATQATNCNTSGRLIDAISRLINGWGPGRGPGPPRGGVGVQSILLNDTLSHGHSQRPSHNTKNIHDGKQCAKENKGPSVKPFNMICVI